MNLVPPTAAHERAAMEYRREFLDYGERHINGSWGLQRGEYDDFSRWLSDLEDRRTGNGNNPRIQVPATTYFALEGDKIVGTIQVRHRLNDYLLQSGGHIGYAIRPSERRKGYGARMLALALEECRRLGIDRALITCDKDNAASAKTALRNGGVLENEFINDEGNIEQRYWITLKVPAQLFYWP
jgi:predicted acetyltransferase